MAVISAFSRYAIPFLLFAIPLYAWWKGVPIYETFVNGAMEGLKMVIKILPYLVAMLVVIQVFRASGALDGLAALLSPITSFLGIPSEVVPLALMRPLSGSGALGIAADLIESHGPDSFIGRLASVMQGSTDTTFYILTVYFGSIGLRRYRHAMAAGLIADCASFIAAAFLCRLLFPVS